MALVSYSFAMAPSLALGETLMGIFEPEKDTSGEESQKMADIGSMKVTKEEFKEVAPVSIRSSIPWFLLACFRVLARRSQLS